MDLKSGHQYTPLPRPGWIRVLTILPLGRDCDVRCINGTIDTRPLDYDSGFTALSYSWATADGDDAKTHAIAVDGRELPVTQNLFEALLWLRRSSGGEVRVWVDAICINQGDVEERNQQVVQMKNIYRYADETIAWLGDEDDEQALAVLECFGGHGADAYGDCAYTHVHRTADGDLINLCEFRRQRTRLTDDWHPTETEHRRRIFETELAVCVSRIMTRRYFTRRWVVQEIHHSRNLLLTWGSSQLPLRSFIAGVQNFLNMLMDIAWNTRHAYMISAALQILEMRTNANDGRVPVALSDVVSKCHHLQCSDPRDIIFALTSLSRACSIQPDYNMSYEQVCTAFSAHLIQRGLFGTLLENLQYYNLLYCAEGPTKQNRRLRFPESKALPTWVLDLQKPFRTSFQSVTNTAVVATVNLDMSLSCGLYLIGVVVKVEGDRLSLGNPQKSRKARRGIVAATAWFQFAVFTRPGDRVFAFGHSSNDCYDALLLRWSKERGAYWLLHWTQSICLEPEGRGEIIRPAGKRTTVRIV